MRALSANTLGVIRLLMPLALFGIFSLSLFSASFGTFQNVQSPFSHRARYHIFVPFFCLVSCFSYWTLPRGFFLLSLAYLVTYCLTLPPLAPLTLCLVVASFSLVVWWINKHLYACLILSLSHLLTDLVFQPRFPFVNGSHIGPMIKSTMFLFCFASQRKLWMNVCREVDHCIH